MIIRSATTNRVWKLSLGHMNVDDMELLDARSVSWVDIPVTT